MTHSATLAVVSACWISATGGPLQAQLSRGFESKLQPSATGQELNRQSDLWIMEVDFKPMRMLAVDITNPKTGEKTREYVWYLVYRAVNRELGRQEDDTDTVPINDEDIPPPPLFIPEFTLMTADNTGSEVHLDNVIPEAQLAVMRRERTRLNNSVEAVREIAPAVPPSDPDEEKFAIYGVAMWRGIDPKTDKFSVFMSGFSNGYVRSTGPDGEPLTLRRTIVQEYWRPGDEFFQNEGEFRTMGEPRWIYRPDDVTLPANDGDGEAAAPQAAPAADDAAAPATTNPSAQTP